MIKKAILFAILLLVLQFIIRKLLSLDFQKEVFNHTPGPCRIVQGKGIGYEDMETLQNGLTFITSGLSMPSSSHILKEYLKNHGRKGRIYLFDFNKPDKNLQQLTILGDQFDQTDFSPHGISVWTNGEGRVILMVVNHKMEEDTIEKSEFDENSRQLKHLKTYRDPNIHFVNDVAMVSENSFYFTNYAYYRSEFMHFIEVIMPLHYGNLMYYDGKNFIKQDDGFVTANGVVVSKDQKYVYMVESVTSMFYIYTRQSNGTLSRYQIVNLHTKGDNPTIDKDGNILIGAHPIAWKTLKHMDNPDHPAPSQVIKLHLKDGNVTRISEVLSDDGHTLYGSTVASVYKDAILVGTIIHKLLYCQVQWMD